MLELGRGRNAIKHEARANNIERTVIVTENSGTGRSVNFVRTGNRLSNLPNECMKTL